MTRDPRFKFRKGDRVRVTDTSRVTTSRKVGDVGTVWENNRFSPVVIFDTPDATWGSYEEATGQHRLERIEQPQTLPDWDYVEGAMCLWEEVLDLNRRDDIPLYLSKVKDRGGFGELRRFVGEVMAPVLAQCWPKAVALSYDEPFDWEFVPLFLLKYEEANGDPDKIVEAIMKDYKP